MKFSFNLIRSVTKKKIIINKLLKIIDNKGFEINSIIKKKSNIKIIFGKIINKKKIKKNFYKLYIDINLSKFLKIYTKINKFRKNSFILVIKEKNLNIKSKYLYHISNNNFFYINKNYKKAGLNINNYLNINNDYIIDISIPFNRKDCLSSYGIYRELYNDKLYKKINKNNIYSNSFKINLKDNICNYYCGILIKNIHIEYKTPIIIKNYLENIDIEIKNNILDIVNFIYAKTGYIIHIIDTDIIKNNLTIEFINNYNKNDINIINIINSKLFYNNTKNIFLGCAIFNNSIFENNLEDIYIKNYMYNISLDSNLLKSIIEYSKKIILDIFGGNSKKILYIINNNHKKNILKLCFKNIRNKTGIFIRNRTILKIIKKINCLIHKINKKFLYIIIPEYRLDLNYEEDIVEEILKIYNIDKIISKNIDFKINFSLNKNNNSLNKIKNYLIYNNYNEVINNIFINKNKQEILFNKKNIINIKNPISNEKSSIRTSLIFGLINNIIYNIKKNEENIKIFEYGKCFEIKNNILLEKKTISGAVLLNDKNINNIYYKNNKIYKVKSDVYNILSLFLYNNYYFLKKNNLKFLIKNLRLSIISNKKNIGFLGIINNLYFNKELKNNLIIIFEINIICNNKLNDYTINKLSKFHLIKRDISILINKNINIENLIKSIYTIDIKIYKIKLIDLYNLYNINNLNIIIRIFIQIYNNISEYEINIIINKCIFFLKNKFNIKIL